MTPPQIDSLLKRCHRQILLIRILRVLLMIGTVAAILWASSLPRPLNKQATFGLFIAAMLVWVLSMLNSSRLARQVRTAGALLSIGQLDDAEVWLLRTIERFSLSARTKALALQQYASVFFCRDAHAQVVQICRSILKERIAGLKHVWINTRLMLADSLLMLNQVPEAYDAIRPVCDAQLSLADRMKLLPIQLRYELAADFPAAALRNLPEKLQLAELLDSPRAALVHALLAEACRRSHMPTQEAFLAQRAWLYHDLDTMASRYPVIAPIVAQPASTTSK